MERWQDEFMDKYQDARPDEFDEFSGKSDLLDDEFDQAEEPLFDDLDEAFDEAFEEDEF